MTVAILPMKPPTVGKTRLAGEFDPSFRSELAEAMFLDVLAALALSQLIDRTLVVTADQDCAKAATAHGAATVDDPGCDGHSSAASLGAREAALDGAERVLLVPGDCPALDPAEVDSLIGEADRVAGCLVVPDRHGTGTNALLICPPLAMAPSFGPGSHRRHLALAAGAGVRAESVAVPSLAFDVDTPEDLESLIEHLRDGHAAAPRTRSLLARTGRLPAHA
ncbi:MAG: 2-phospho-L-lactate guanylyltransferase [Actinomycetes bacterium]